MTSLRSYVLKAYVPFSLSKFCKALQLLTNRAETWVLRHDCHTYPTVPVPSSWSGQMVYWQTNG
jgi:hypothetical protein